MAGACGDNASAQGASDERQVAQHVEQFVACRLVVVSEWLVVDITQLAGVFVLHLHQVGEFVEVGLLHGRVVDDDGVIQVAALDKVELQQWHHLAHKHEGAGSGNLVLELAQVVERGKLVGEHR